MTDKNMLDIISDFVDAICNNQSFDANSYSEHLIFSKLSGGLMNQMYLIENNTNKFVLRIFNTHILSKDYDRINHSSKSLFLNDNYGDQYNLEFDILNIASNIGISHKILHEKNNKFILMEYFDGCELKNCTSEIINNIMISLKKLHTSSDLKNIKSFDPFVDAINTINLYDIKYDVDTLEKISNINKIVHEHNEKYLGFCHNDFHSGNILVDKNNKISIIDYDYAGKYDIMYDLATFANSMNLNDEQKYMMLNMYFGEVTDNILKRYKYFMILCYFWNSIWYLSRISQNNEFSNIGLQYLNKIQELI